jgi:methylmalonyl-CoA/ethylmalonyl-CoA epimerase
MSKQPVFSQVLQIFIVVDDCEKYARTYEEAYGIGPWSFQDFSDAAVPRKFVNGVQQPYQMKLAICAALNVNLALIEPLDELSIFSRFLAEHGPGVHHLLLGSELGYERALTFAGQRGMPVIQGGATASGLEYSHLDMTRDLGMIVELFGMRPDAVKSDAAGDAG